MDAPSGVPAPQATTLSDWFATPLEAYLLAREQGWFDRTVADIFGFTALQIGLPGCPFLAQNRIALRVTAGLAPGCWRLRADPRQLPLASQSVDLVVLPHVLEFGADPHQILREAERVLMPEGRS